MRNRWLLTLVCLGMVAPAVAQIGDTSNFPRLNFNVGGGYGIGRGDVGAFVGNSFFAVGGAGMNFNRIFGFSGEYMYYDLGLRQSVSNGQHLGSTSGSMDAASLNGIVHVPYHFGRLGAYGIFGVGFYDRRVSSNTGLIGSPNPSVCQPAWVWWDIYCLQPNPSVPPVTAYPQHLGSFSKIAGGYNFGGGITYRLNRWHNAKLYGEFRYHKAYQSDAKTIVWPITIGLRW